MKTKLMSLVILVVIAMVLGAGRSPGVCPDPVPPSCDPNTVPFVFDPNIVLYKLLGSIQVKQTNAISILLRVCDPDDDPVAISLLGGPPGASVVLVDNSYYLRWTPTLLNLGVYVLNIQAVDQPEKIDEALSDRGSILVKVYKANKPPVFIPSCGG